MLLKIQDMVVSNGNNTILFMLKSDIKGVDFTDMKMILASN